MGKVGGERERHTGVHDGGGRKELKRRGMVRGRCYYGEGGDNRGALNGEGEWRDEWSYVCLEK